MVIVLFLIVPIAGIIATFMGWKALWSTRKTPLIRLRHLKLKDLP